MYGGDEVGAMVLDMGSSFMKVGFSGEDMPKAVFSSYVGIVPNSISAMDISSPSPSSSSSSSSSSSPSSSSSSLSAAEIESTTPPRKSRPPRKYKIGRSQEIFRPDMDIKPIVQDGCIEEWGAFEDLFDYCMNDHLKMDVAEHPMIILEPVHNSIKNREKMLELMFETHQAPACFLAKDAVTAAYAVGRSNALVIDIGGGTTTCTPVLDGYALHGGYKKTKVAGNMLDKYLHKLVFQDQKRVCHPHFKLKREILASGTLRSTVLDLQGLTLSYDNMMTMKVVRDLKETVTRVSEYPFDGSNVNIPSEKYELPDGQTIDIATQRFLIPEILFKPHGAMNDFIGEERDSSIFDGLAEMVKNSIDACDADIRKELYANIVLTGGSSVIPGIGLRLQHDLNNLIPPAFRVKIFTSQTNLEKRFGPWVGGSVLGSLGTFHQLWYSKQEYSEYGTSRLASKCP